MNELAIIALNVLFYARTLRYGGIIDDDAAMIRADKMRHSNPLVDMWKHLRGDYIKSPAFSHALSMLVHTLNCVLIYYVFGRNNISLLAALLFAVNPVNTQVSIWMSGRAYGVATSLILLGFLFPLAFPAFYALSFYWSINSIVAPVIFLFIGMPVMALSFGIAYLMKKHFWKTFTDRKKTVPPRMNKLELKKLILAVKTFAYYTIVCLFPMRVGMCHAYLHTFGLTEEETKPWFKLDKFFFLGLLEISAIIWLIASGRAFGYIGIVWFSVFILQWCNFIVINHPIAERYAYLANVGLMVFLATLIYNTPLMYVFLTFYATKLWLFTPAYKNNVSFWYENMKSFPTVAMAYNQLGLALQQHGKFGTVFDVFNDGIKQRPKDFRLNYNMAGLLASNRRFETIKPYLEAAEQNIDPMNNPDMWKANLASMRQFCSDNGFNLSDNGSGKEQPQEVKDADIQRTSDGD